ncbi:phosphocarrier protein HPr /dihydroxyacetone kinase DhaM subunit [Arthrobacter sp. SLBN-83]|uniref:dihydroxyacetone kinase phosphoryl donor subunit DhaM n=1 Tax=Arthrobacter sp. SLBN-83 TaxID=2768449 RepID=UPI001150A73C|nr:dihydroxyacetone kinase phosphoryl donor subunit DhaM [Arthrobacter sp. SLBN-83]TQJ58774.1 phosphocarrier protein HPr /dihydroxyacetone kinase DhaM subunit [Arthrobacter sp. SLBN-83]
MTVSIVVVSHSEKIADGAVELAAQMAPDVMILPAGGTDDGRIGTSLEKVLAALEQVSDRGGGQAGGDGTAADGTVVITDLGSAVMTAESALEFLENPAGVLLADAPLVEGLVAAAVAAQGGADVQAVRKAAEAAGGPAQPAGSAASGAVEPVTSAAPDSTGDFELVNQAGMHARPAAKVAGGLASLDAEVTINGVDGASMTGLMTLGAGKGTVLHVEAWGHDAERAVEYVGGLVEAGFGEP